MNHPRTTAIGLCLLPSFFALMNAGKAAGPATTQATTQAAAPVVDEQKQMLTLWDQLAEPEPFCTKALLDMSSKPDQTVAFLKEHLNPLKLEQKDLEEMIKALGSDDEKAWRTAVDQMQYLDPRLAMDVEPMLELADNQTSRNRLIEVRCDLKPGTLKDATLTFRKINAQTLYFQQVMTNGGYRVYTTQPKVAQLDNATGQVRKKQWARADRAIVLLQHIGTPEAIALLKDLATGNPDAQPTRIARLAVDSLGG